MSVTITLPKLTAARRINLRSAKTRQLQSSSNKRIRQWSLNSEKTQSELKAIIRKINICTSGEIWALTKKNNALVCSLAKYMNPGFWAKYLNSNNGKSLTQAIEEIDGLPSSRHSLSGTAEGIINNTEALSLNSDTKKFYYALFEGKYKRYLKQLQIFQKQLMTIYPNLICNQYDIQNADINNILIDIKKQVAGLNKIQLPQILNTNINSQKIELIISYNGSCNAGKEFSKEASINHFFDIAEEPWVKSLTLINQQCMSSKLIRDIQSEL